MLDLADDSRHIFNSNKQASAEALSNSQKPSDYLPTGVYEQAISHTRSGR